MKPIGIARIVLLVVGVVLVILPLVMGDSLPDMGEVAGAPMITIIGAAICAAGAAVFILGVVKGPSAKATEPVSSEGEESEAAEEEKEEEPEAAEEEKEEEAEPAEEEEAAEEEESEAVGEEKEEEPEEKEAVESEPVEEEEAGATEEEESKES